MSARHSDLRTGPRAWRGLLGGKFMMRAGPLFALAALLVSPAAAAHESYVVDHNGSHLVAVVGSAGILSIFGHPHAVIATDGEASICYAAPHAAATSVSFSVPTRSLLIDTPRALRIAKLGPLPPGVDRRELQEAMLSERFLWAERHPRLSFESTRVQQVNADTLWLEGRFSMRGITRPVAFPVRVQANGESMRLSGEITVRQTDFGMKPESIAGVVRVADAVDVRFLILARGEGEGC